MPRGVPRRDDLHAGQDQGPSSIRSRNRCSGRGGSSDSSCFCPRPTWAKRDMSEMIERQARLGDVLREWLHDCWLDDRQRDAAAAGLLHAATASSRRRSWPRCTGGRSRGCPRCASAGSEPVLRACITSFRTTRSGLFAGTCVREQMGHALATGRQLRRGAMKSETMAIHGGYDLDADDQGRCGSDLPDRRLRLRQRRSRRGAVQSGGRGLPLHAYQQSDHRRSGAPCCRAGRRGGGDVRGLRPGGGALRGAQPRRTWAPTSSRRRSSTARRTRCSRIFCRAGRDGALRDVRPA